MIPILTADRNPNITDKLFVSNGDSLAWLNKSFQEFGSFADCYQNSAISLIDSALTEERYRDFKIYPIIFLMRHYFELRLKELLQGINYLEKQTEEFPTGHNLNSLWEAFRYKYDKVVEKIDPNDEVIKSMRKMIEEISVLDPNSMTFRYPVDRDGNKIEKPEYIDLNNLKAVFVRACRVLDGMSMQVSSYSDSVKEMLHEAYSYYDM